MIKFALYQGTDLIAKAIRTFQQGKYSHVAGVLPNGAVIEAVKGAGVVISESVAHRHKRGTVVDFFEFKLKPTQTELDIMISFAEAQLGKGYDMPMVLNFVSKSRVQEARESMEKWFCSELWFASAWKAGLRLHERVEPWQVDPVWFPRSVLLKQTGSVTI